MLLLAVGRHNGLIYSYKIHNSVALEQWVRVEGAEQIEVAAELNEFSIRK
jgi:hypothetical protein